MKYKTIAIDYQWTVLATQPCILHWMSNMRGSRKNFEEGGGFEGYPTPSPL